MGLVFIVNGQMNKDQESHKLECIVILKKVPLNGLRLLFLRN